RGTGYWCTPPGSGSPPSPTPAPPAPACSRRASCGTPHPAAPATEARPMSPAERPAAGAAAPFVPSRGDEGAGIMAGMDESAFATVRELERELQSPATRADEHRLRQLLAPDFLEVGASGRQWDRETTLALLREQSDDDDTPT